MTTSDPLLLSSNDFFAAVDPGIGGSLLYWRQKNDDLLRSASPEAIERKAADETAMFPLVPYSNRIRGGYFIYWGIKRRVPKNHPVVADPLHGEGWQTEWNVMEHAKDNAKLFFRHNGKNGFPFAYEAQQDFTLQDNSLIVSLTLTNKGGIPMPCGLGWHPFFPKDDDTKVFFKTKNVWAHESAPPRERPIKTPAEWQFDKGLKISELELDTCFGGFDGKVEMIWPQRNRKINMTAYNDFGHVVVWSPAGESFFCVEPVTNATDAFNLASRGITGTGIKTLDPDESLTETMTLTVSGLNTL